MPVRTTLGEQRRARLRQRRAQAGAINGGDHGWSAELQFGAMLWSHESPHHADLEIGAPAWRKHARR